MKKLFYLIMSVALTTMVSCQKEQEFIDIQNDVAKTFYATFENGAATRTALDAKNDVLWSEGDQLSVFGGTTANNSFILNEGAGTTYGTFVVNSAAAGTESSGSTTALSANAAYYPYDSNVTVSDNSGSFTFNATFPATQTYSASGTFGQGASPMVAVTASTLDANLKFKNVGAIFRLQLKGDATITKVVFSADANLAGKVAITASNSATPTVNVTEGSNTVILNCGEGVALNNSTPTNFVVAMLPIENVTGGITITIYDNAGKKMVYTHKADDAITIERSKAYTTDEVTYNGDQDAVTAVGAQAALYAATSGTTIQLEPGVDYGTLVFRQNIGTKVVDINDIGGDAAGNEHYSKYENITIIGAPGATVDQIDFQVGWIDNSKGASYVDIKNLTIKNVTFSGEKTAINLEGAKGGNLGIDGLTIDGCTMIDAEGNDRFVFQQISGYKELSDKSISVPVMTTGVKNLTINNCTVEGAYMVIESRAMENLKITNNKFKGIKARDMLITSDVTNHPDKTYTGEITITGNTSTDGEERFVRASLNNSNATVTIKDNKIINYKGADFDFMKVTDHTGTLEIDNNSFAVPHNDDNYFQKLVLNAMDGTVFKLAAKDYGVLDFTHTYNGKTVTAKNITIQGVEGTQMTNLVSPSSVINGWKVTGVKFVGIDGGSQKGIDIRAGGDGITVTDCEFSNANVYLNNSYKNITVQNCSFDDSTTGGVYLQGVEDVIVSGCTFSNMKYNAIQLSGAGVSGNVNITNNTINTCVSRAMRIVTNTGATLTITGNKMTNANNASDDSEADRGQVVKISGSVLTGTFNNNTHNGNDITFTNGIATESE